jgi:nitrite reductase/ring-hydroxylating ferredoxin subunit
MGGQAAELSGPDFGKGVVLAEIPQGKTLGQANGEAVLVVRQGDQVFAIGASCTHYGASLAGGLVVGDTVRCPAHHACFSLSSPGPRRPSAR